MSKFKRIDLVKDSVDNLDEDFNDILQLSGRCKYPNCTHTTEQHCCVKHAISEGTLSQERYDEYYRITKEAEYVANKKNKTKAMDYMRKLKLFRPLK